MKSLLFVCIIVCIASSIEAQKKVVCYYGSWSVWRAGNGHFEVFYINPNICTHIMYSFLGVDEDGQIVLMDPWLDAPYNGGRNYIGKFTSLRSINPNVKLMAAVGGWNFGSTVFSHIAASPELRARFASNVAEFLAQWKFDGIDIDWEYPAQRGGVAADKANFVLLLQQLKETLQPIDKLVTIAVGAARQSASVSYNIPEVVKHVDFINLMTYDLHGSWDGVTGIHSPLYSSSKDLNLDLNVDACVKYWLSKGCPKEKLIVGIPTYGKTFTLANANNNGLGAPTIGPGKAGAFVAESGFLPYNEICYNNNSWTHFWVEEQQVPYAFKHNQWVGYDNIQSVDMKLNYILANDLGGAMFWSIETDDFSNICKQGRFPLITLAYDYMTGKIEPKPLPSTTTIRTTTKNIPSTTANPGGPTAAPKKFFCPAYTGFYPDPNNCSKFYQCASGFSYSFTCPSNLYFNQLIGVCDWPENVRCESE